MTSVKASRIPLPKAWTGHELLSNVGFSFFKSGGVLQDSIDELLALK